MGLLRKAGTMSGPVFDNHADPQICTQCKGLCCQGHPGVWIDPERFLHSFGLPRPADPADWLPTLSGLGLVLRNIDGVAIPAPAGSEDGCTFLKARGCSLPDSRRPCQCLLLTPALETLIEGEIHCHLPPEGSTLSAIRRWSAFWQNT